MKFSPEKVPEVQILLEIVNLFQQTMPQMKAHQFCFWVGHEEHLSTGTLEEEDQKEDENDQNEIKRIELVNTSFERS